MYSKIQPKSFIPYLGTFQCLLEDQLNQQTSSKQTRQSLLVITRNIIEILKNVVPFSSLSPSLLLVKQCLFTIAKQATAISLVEKATECLVIIVRLVIC